MQRASLSASGSRHGGTEHRKNRDEKNVPSHRPQLPVSNFENKFACSYDCCSVFDCRIATVRLFHPEWTRRNTQFHGMKKDERSIFKTYLIGQALRDNL